MKYTGNYNLKKPEGTDIVNIDDLNNNADILDQKLKEVENKADSAPPNSVNDAAIGSRTPNQSQAPASPGTGTLTQLISWLANRIKATTGKTNWWDAPPTTLQAAKNHIDAAAPHSGHETPSGAQEKANAALNSAKQYTDQEVAEVSQALDAHKAESASTSQKGHVQLSTSTTSTSTSLAATASAVKTVNDALTSHKAAAAPHSGHETPAGAQAKANTAEANAKGYTDTHAGTKNSHGVGSGYYIAKTSRSDQLPAWNDVKGKPSNFTPSAHKSTHASGGSDALTPSDIGAETPSGAQAKVNTHANSKQSHGVSSGYYIAKTSRSDQLPAWNDIQGKPDLASAADLQAHLSDNVKHITSSERNTWNNKLNASAYTAADVLAKVKTVDGDGSGLDADLLDGAHAGNGPNNVLKLDSGGLVPLPNIPGTLTGKSSDMVDGKHFSDIQNDAQAKANTALNSAKAYTDQEVEEVIQALDAHESDASAHHTRYTDAEAVAAIKAADGAGSGIDADMLDGKHGSAYANASHSHSASDLPSASTSAKGIVQLSASTSSTSTSLAATPSAVKAAYDLANSKADSVATVNNKKAGYAVYAP